MRKYIFLLMPALAACFLLTSCTEEVEEPAPKPLTQAELAKKLAGNYNMKYEVSISGTIATQTHTFEDTGSGTVAAVAEKDSLKLTCTLKDVDVLGKAPLSTTLENDTYTSVFKLYKFKETGTPSYALVTGSPTTLKSANIMVGGSPLPPIPLGSPKLTETSSDLEVLAVKGTVTLTQPQAVAILSFTDATINTAIGNLAATTEIPLTVTVKIKDVVKQ